MDEILDRAAVVMGHPYAINIAEYDDNEEKQTIRVSVKYVNLKRGTSNPYWFDFPYQTPIKRMLQVIAGYLEAAARGPEGALDRDAGGGNDGMGRDGRHPRLITITPEELNQPLDEEKYPQPPSVNELRKQREQKLQRDLEGMNIDMKEKEANRVPGYWQV